MPKRRIRKGKENTILIVIGRKGSGKSTLVKRIAEDLDRVIVMDTVHEYEPEDGFEIVDGFDACVNRIETAAQEERFRFACRTDSIEETLDLISLVATMRDLTLIVEETAFYCSPSEIPDEISLLVRAGRHREISQIYVTQRPAMIHRHITASADVVISFQAHEPRDVAYFRALAGKKGEAVRTLPRFRVLAWGEIEKAPLPVIEALHVPLDTSREEA